MQITIDLPPDLEKDLLRQAAQSDVSLQTLILQALPQTLQTLHVPTGQWAEALVSNAHPRDQFLPKIADRMVPKAPSIACRFSDMSFESPYVPGFEETLETGSQPQKVRAKNF